MTNSNTSIVNFTTSYSKPDDMVKFTMYLVNTNILMLRNQTSIVKLTMNLLIFNMIAVMY